MTLTFKETTLIAFFVILVMNLFFWEDYQFLPLQENVITLIIFPIIVVFASWGIQNWVVWRVSPWLHQKFQPAKQYFRFFLASGLAIIVGGVVLIFIIDLLYLPIVLSIMIIGLVCLMVATIIWRQ